MSVTTIAWGGTNLARCTRYTIDARFVGTQSRTANATLRVDSFSDKRRIVLEWDALTSSERTTLYNAYIAKGSSANNLTTPDNQTISVMAVQNGWVDANIYHDDAINGFRYDVRLTFDEV